jgi:hypothetical protein
MAPMDDLSAVGKGDTCAFHAKLMEEHGALIAKMSAVENIAAHLSGRPTWAVASIIGFLLAIMTLFATLHFSESSLLYEVSGKQQIMLKQMSDMQTELISMHEQSTRNAGALDALSSQISRKP